VATEEIQGLLQASASPVFNSFDEVRSWCATVQEPRSACVLHIDTGMNRLGMTRRDVERLAGQADLLEALEIRFVMTHLACAEDAAHQRNELQLQRFDELRRLLPTAPTSIANSSGIFLDSRFHGDLTRAGIALFGSNPQPGRPNPMKEVARLQGRIIQVRHVDSPDAVGYGATADVASGSILATVSFGYADGYPRMLGNEASVAVGSSFAPVVGRVSMDTLVIDVSEVPREAAREGCWVDLAGGGINWDNLASQAGTISYELLTRIGPRVVREYLGP
jgi:alanine racemase